MSNNGKNNSSGEYEILQQSILEQLRSSKQIRDLLKRVYKSSTKEYICGLNSSTKAIISAYISNNLTMPAVFITSKVSNALRIQMELSWLSELPVKYFPNPESSPYELGFTTANTIKDQLDCIELLINNTPSIIVTTPKAIAAKFLAPKDFTDNSLTLRIGNDGDPVDLANNLSILGYSRVPVIMDPGEYSQRGDIVDIFPVSNEPVRIEFGFDEVESIRLINIETQRSIKKLESITIRPRYKVIIDKNNKSTVINNIKKHAEEFKLLDESAKTVLNTNVENYSTLLKEFNYFEGVEYLSPYAHEKLASILDYLPEESIIFLDDNNDIESQFRQNESSANDEYLNGVKAGRLLPIPFPLHFSGQEIFDKIQKHSTIYLNTLQAEIEGLLECIEFTYEYVPGFLGNLKQLSEYIIKLKKQKYNVIITTEYPQRVKSVLSEWGCNTIYLSEDTIDKVNPGDIIITKVGPSSGYLWPDFKIASITDLEIFGKRSKKLTIAKHTSKRENLDFFLSPADLHENDYVVHARHGIGRFTNMQKMKIDNQEREYLTIQYQGNDKLYVPVDQINLLSRYRGVGDTPPKLTKMGGADWESIKRKAAKAVEDIATDLLTLYARRARLEGYSFDSDTTWQMEMEDSFEYIETPDQLKSIIDVKKDMESSNPMDRLVCGDVGYGKTEVAIRAIFKAVLSGKQVAFLVPTTILAQQHFNTLTQRFLPYPMNIAMLSRFRTAKEQKDTIGKLITGECDIVIGTHRLLQKDIQFKNLGLVVIDEEHRFGVKHKEQLKQLRSQVDVISMSATPIPRTLYMALSGIRDLSIINTPPVNRSPIKTYVGEHNNNLVRSAILRELERDGQVYYVHNRVQTIDKVAYDLSQLLPDVRIAIGHGQMNEKELETIMLDFSNHKYDVLVCTTIIESGLDIPNVNTIIIENSDMMGLAQLYQLRGRVGRSDRQAYAYCFYKHNKVLTSEAQKRLMAIREFNTLGSGYQVALRDLEIRGVGNILGSQQHGNMVAVGFDLYCEMLEEAVQNLSGHKVVKKTLPVVDINVTAYIPDTWIEDRDQKIVEYKRLASVDSFRELEIIVEEWKDRFGNLPEVVITLVTIVKVRLLSSEVGFNYIREEADFVRIFTNYDFKFWHQFSRKLPPHLAKRTRWVQMPKTSVEGNSAILVKYSGLIPKEVLNYIEELCSYLNNYLREQKGDLVR